MTLRNRIRMAVVAFTTRQVLAEIWLVGNCFTLALVAYLKAMRLILCTIAILANVFAADERQPEITERLEGAIEWAAVVAAQIRDTSTAINMRIVAGGKAVSNELLATGPRK